MRLKFTKKDWILVIIIIAIIVIVYCSHYFLREAGTGNVVVKVSGKITGVYTLDHDDTITINGGTNTLEIKNGKANMIEANCPEQLCVHQKAISDDKRSIICLPNKVLVEVKSKEKSSIDAVSN